MGQQPRPPTGFRSELKIYGEWVLGHFMALRRFRITLGLRLAVIRDGLQN